MFNTKKMNAKDAKRLKQLKTQYLRELQRHTNPIGYIPIEDAAFLKQVSSTVEFKVILTVRVGRYREDETGRAAWLEPKISLV